MASNHRVVGLNNRNLCSHSSENLKAKVKVRSGLVPGEASLLDFFGAETIEVGAM